MDERSGEPLKCRRSAASALISSASLVGRFPDAAAPQGVAHSYLEICTLVNCSRNYHNVHFRLNIVPDDMPDCVFELIVTEV